MQTCDMISSAQEDSDATILLILIQKSVTKEQHMSEPLFN